MEKETQEQIETEAEKLYSDLPYHNFDHARKVIKNTEKFIARCRDEKIPVLEEVIFLAALFHDAGYGENEESKGYATKESYAAHLAEQVLLKLKVKKRTIIAVQQTILATYMHAKPTTTEQKILRAADLLGLAGPYEQFRVNAKNLEEESIHLYGKEKGKEMTRQIITAYIAQDIYLTTKHDDEFGESVFHKKAQENLTRYLAEE